MPYLDGIRAIAVIGVVLFHLGFKPIHGGFTGVDVFFVLSGFLITTIIGAQHADGRFSFTEFYIRRARRLLPALLVVIFFVLIGSFLILSPDGAARFFTLMHLPRRAPWAWSTPRLRRRSR